MEDVNEIIYAMSRNSRKFHQKQINVGTNMGYTYFVGGYVTYSSDAHNETERRDDVADVVSTRVSQTNKGQAPTPVYVNGYIIITDWSDVANSQVLSTNVFDDASAVWTIIGVYPTYHEFPAYSNTGNYAFVAEGKFSGVLSRYDSVSKTYRNGISVQTAEGAAGGDVYGYFLSGGGNSHQSDYYRIDTVVSAIKTVSSTVAGTIGGHGLWTSAFSLDNVIYFNGGGAINANVSSYVDTVGVFYADFMNMLIARRQHTSTACNGYGFVAGAQSNGNTDRKKCDRLDLTTRVASARAVYAFDVLAPGLCSTQHSLI